MSFAPNLLMLAAGYVPAADVADALGKSLSTVHRMVDAGLPAQRDGVYVYVSLDGLEQHYAAQPTMHAAVRALRARIETSIDVLDASAAPPTKDT